MVAEFEGVGVKITADTSSLDKATGDIKNFSNNATSNFKSVIAQGALMVGAFKAISSSVSGIRHLSAHFGLASNRIKQATRETGDFGTVLKEISSIANDTGSDIEHTAELFQGMARVGEHLGATNQQLLKVTKTIQQLGIASGTSAVNIGYAQTQLIRGFENGIIQLGEFNSLMENTPELAFALAKELGKTPLEMRKIASSGQLMARDVFKALDNLGDEANKKFKEIPLTFAQETVSLKNSLSKLVGTIDEELGISKTARQIVKFTRYLVEAIDEVVRARNKMDEINKPLKVGITKGKREGYQTDYDWFKIFNAKKIENQRITNDTLAQMTKDDFENKRKGFTDLLEEASQHSKIMFEINKAYSIAQALLSAQEAIQSAYAFGAKHGGAVGGAISAGIAGGAVATNLAHLYSVEYKGGKADGGAISRGLYEVNEKGTEMLSQGGKDYLLSSGSGHITPHDKLGGGGNVVVNINNIAGQEVYQTEEARRTSDGIEINLMVRQVEAMVASNIERGDSPIGRIMQNKYRLTRL
ncbi:hypothetical protein AB832_07145 [Flavobacteriaceae bacterium (ex Bugula neritina AB1)]|nr:hypothetical protein AB832_07145 [Flavobacteriaceae bacterium (ex Bugula neritina AB1)]